jgi:L-serine dehydratase
MPENIITSVFDIFKKGPGPSSSHTIGPMKAALDFLKSIQPAAINKETRRLKIDVYLYGSLSATGKGHGTHKAVLGGLLGWSPETCDCDQLLALMDDPEKVYHISLSDLHIPFTSHHIHFEGADPSLSYQNTLRFALTADGTPLFEKEYYSVGGGFIKIKDEPEEVRPDPPHPYHNMREFRKIMLKSGLSLSEIMLQNEEALTGKSREAIFADLDDILQTMCKAVEKGLQTDALLPGPIGLMRKAKVLHANSQKLKHETGRFLGLLNAYAMAASEENAAGRRVVTAPTSGSAGVIPGVVYLMKTQFDFTDQQYRDGLLAAALIGFIAKHNASIAGAEVGCQGEVGVASAMAAALIAYANELPMKQVENAAEIALEHHLGLTCDPIGGFVQIPCIERNAVGAVSAVNAYILAAAGDPARHKLTLDEVVEAMMETGKDMCTKYKETALGGLAVSCVSC